MTEILLKRVLYLHPHNVDLTELCQFPAETLHSFVAVVKISALKYKVANYSDT